MRGALRTLSRSNAAFLLAAFFAGLVVPTCAQAKAPDTGAGPGPTLTSDAPLSALSGDSVAYAVPRNAPADNVEIILPQPLPPSAVAQVRRILALQAAGDDADADRMIGHLDDTTLLGTILADRYLSPNYHSNPAELLDWYEQYNDQPEAGAVYQLLLKKQPRKAVPPLAPVLSLLPEATIGAGLSARPSGTSENPVWRRLFVAALDQWQRGDIAVAAQLFTQAAAMDAISAEDRAAAQFWAARAALRLRQPAAYLDGLHQAASATGTFYGILAGRLLGQGFGPTGLAATLTEADITAVDATPDGHLAFALLQVGATDDAATALRALWPEIQTDPDLGRAVMAVAARAGLVDVALAIGAQIGSAGNEIAGATLPMPPLHPQGGFMIDPALVYALVRNESGFETGATSPCGARGLMQLMPVTAHYIARTDGIAGPITAPATNLAVGQSYIRYLANQGGINGNLLAILASYNAGPGAAVAWYGALRDDSDPLVFLETIPNEQTRRFVRQVLADSWIYAEEIGLKPASLDNLAEGNFPLLDLTSSPAAAVASAAN